MELGVQFLIKRKRFLGLKMLLSLGLLASLKCLHLLQTSLIFCFMISLLRTLQSGKRERERERG